MENFTGLSYQPLLPALSLGNTPHSQNHCRWISHLSLALNLTSFSPEDMLGPVSSGRLKTPRIKQLWWAILSNGNRQMRRASTHLISVLLIFLTFIKADIASQRPREERWNRSFSFAWHSLSCFPGWLRTICILSRPHNFWLLKKDIWVLPKHPETLTQGSVTWRTWEMWEGHLLWFSSCGPHWMFPVRGQETLSLHLLSM